ncbi:MAG: MG2 domain-containing protein, partial [Candidatus Promineifilaceae bacterium]
QAPDGAIAASYDGQTDDLGTADVTLAVPDGDQTDYTLVIETQSTLGDDRIERPITLSRDYRILLTTDKPLYQPGQIIHLRALALSTYDRVPAAGQELQIAIADGKGNTVFRQTVPTSAFGVASADFQLAGEVNTGPYKLTATLGGDSSEKTVTVERYALPKFDLNLTTDRAYYRPGDVVRGSLNAVYFFGKPVADSPVTIEGFTFDFERQDALSLQGTTDAQGNFEFEFTLPSFIAGSDLEGGLGAFYLQASVTDQANQTEAKQLSLPVSEQDLIIEAIPEGGQFRPGVENLLYVLVSTPDGLPAPADLEVMWQSEGGEATAVTNPYGLAQIPFTPSSPYQQITIVARDDQGRMDSHMFTFDGSYQAEAVLLRPDKPIYQVGETMNLVILTSAQSGAVYLDIIREGQTISTGALPITDGRALAAIDVTPDLFGTLELHAYKILRDGAITRDTRLVLVDEANDLALTFSPDKEEYLPGDTAVLTIQSNDPNGAGVPSAIGLAVVDEAVFALAEQDPGFAKLYFMLEQELLQP